MNTPSKSVVQEIISLQDTVVRILDRLDELSLSVDDPSLKMSVERATNKLQDAELNLNDFRHLE